MMSDDIIFFIVCFWGEFSIDAVDSVMIVMTPII